MKFHPFKLDYFSKEDFTRVELEDIVKVKEKNRINDFLPLLYIECPHLHKKIHVGDIFYDETRNIFFIFSIVKEKIPFPKNETKCGAKSFGFIIRKKDEIHFIPYSELVIQNMSLTYIGNVFNKKEGILNTMKETMHDIELNNAIYELFKENNLNLYIKIKETKQTKEKVIKLKDLLSLHAVFLKNLNENHFTIKLYICKNDFIHLEGFSGDLFLIKEEYQENLDIYSLVSERNKEKLKGKTKKYLKNLIKFHKEVFISLKLEHSVVHYINPNMVNLEDDEDLYVVECNSHHYKIYNYNLDNKIYNKSFLKLL